MIRAFIAINISPEIQGKLAKVSKELRLRLKDVPLRWVPVENIHLTLKFLGDVSPPNLEVLIELLRAETRAYSAFKIGVGKLGAFPTPRKPRVLWVKVDAPPELLTFQEGIEEATARLGFTPDNKPFSPHLTLARVARNASNADMRRISDVLEAYQAESLGTTLVEAVHVYKSDLRPEGAVYTTLYSAAFGPSKYA